MAVKPRQKKLVLFDLDGTLIRPLAQEKAIQRFSFAIKEVFGKDVQVLVTVDMWKKYNGWGDRAILGDLLKGTGVTRDALLDHLGVIGRLFCEYLDRLSQEVKPYEAIPEAKKLLEAAIKAQHLTVGILTGNLGEATAWKLRFCGYEPFSFGVLGHEADKRVDLAQLVIPKAEKFLGWKPHPSNIIFIGDTVHDVACARSVGSPVVIVHTGWNVDKDDLHGAQPDLLVDSLMDERVWCLLGLTLENS